ncbi:hypothetical protein Ocin01_17315 [Orchesella cincta]|uniref:Ferric-chelate reductase 1 n=1 Tax=Orchesella cincta TaxID=48709 RepID=A0A1D2M8Q7_ORCCI|nr:hypothetical protein Ocin01_17315 [Orchesella cincta]
MILLLLLLFEAQLNSRCFPVEGHPTVQCVQTGSGYITPGVYQPSWHLRQGSFTIGAKNFDSAYGGAMSSSTGVWSQDPDAPKKMFLDSKQCPYRWHHESTHEVQLCDELDTRVKLRVNAVQQTDASGKKHTLAGWLHFEVELVDKSDSIRMVYAQMYDEYLNAIGEFITDPAEQCVASDPDKLVTPSLFQYLPCSAIGAREDKPSQALYMVHSEDLIKKSLKGSKYLPKEELNWGLHFTWRMNEYWCSRHYRITPMIFILTKNNIENWVKTTNNGATADDTFRFLRKQGAWKLYRKIPNYWLLPDWFGAADIKHPERGPVQCNSPVFVGTGFNESLTGEAPWIKGLKKHNTTQEYFYWKNRYLVATHGNIKLSGSIICQQNPYYIIEYSTFVGRCKKHIDTEKQTSHEFYQTCNTNKSSPEFDGLSVNFIIHKNYTNDLHAFRKASCNKTCRAPETEEDVVDIANLPDLKRNGTETVIVEESHKHRSKDSVAKFWRGRKFHGILCVICTMFVTPVSLFAARYYKETGMKHVFAGLQIWYWIHVTNSLGLFAIYFSSQMAIRPSISSWGHSEDSFAKVHYILGWISHGIFILLLVFGGVRGGTHGSAVAVRKMVMTAHSVVGFAQYMINIFLVLISTWIPASPTADACDEDGFPIGFSTVAILTFSWVVVDIMFHSLLMFFQVSGDSRLGFQRPWYCPIVPILPGDSTSDMRGSFVRQIVFIVYVGTSGGFTLATILNLGLKRQVAGCIFGEMTCKSPVGCTGAALAICKHLKYTECDV